MAQGIGGRCSCGFDAGRLMSGVLMSGDSFKIVACYECRIMESIKDNDELMQKCGQCNHEMSDVGYRRDGNYTCPSCLKSELFLHVTLMVD